MHKIKAMWKHHPLNHIIEFIDTNVVYDLRDTTPTELYSSVYGEDLELDDLWDKINNNGLLSPVEIHIGRITKSIRLETHNDIVQLWKYHNIPFIPCVVRISDTGITSDNPNYSIDGSDKIKNIRNKQLNMTHWLRPSFVLSNLTITTDLNKVITPHQSYDM